MQTFSGILIDAKLERSVVIQGFVKAFHEIEKSGRGLGKVLLTMMLPYYVASSSGSPYYGSPYYVASSSASEVRFLFGVCPKAYWGSKWRFKLFDGFYTNPKHPDTGILVDVQVRFYHLMERLNKASKVHPQRALLDHQHVRVSITRGCSLLSLSSDKHPQSRAKIHG